jgi:hypothetical protein
MLLAAVTAAVTIFVGPMVRDGCVDVDQGVLDSIKDIQAELAKDESFRVVADPSVATLKFYVVERGIGGPTGSGMALDAPGAILTSPNGQATQLPGTTFYFSAKARHVAALLRVGGYERSFVGEDSEYDQWTRCARLLVRDLSVWLNAE